MITYKPIPILFEIGKIKIYSYGVMLALAFLIPFLLIRKKAEKKLKQHIDILFFLSIIGGLIGARLGWVLINLNQFANIFDILNIWRGGLASYGGIIGALIPIFVYIKRQKLKFLELADLFAPYIALGFAIGRIGCFLNWDDYGKASMFKFALWVNGIPRHATQLYLVAANLIIFGILFFVYNKFHKRKTKVKGRVKKRGQGFSSLLSRDGSLFFLFLLLYSLFRFFIDFLRAYPASEYLAGLAISQWASIFILFASISYFIIRKR